MMDCKRIKKLPMPKMNWAITMKQKGGKRRDSIRVGVVLQGEHLYIKDVETYLGGTFLICNAIDYTACEICQRIDEGIGVITDAARLMQDAVMALWKRVRLPLGVRRITRSPKPETAPDIIVVSKDEDSINF